MGLVKFLTTAATTSSSTVGYRGIWPTIVRKLNLSRSSISKCQMRDYTLREQNKQQDIKLALTVKPAN